ncbi:CPXCG motif-containing cysteine-rich protein [Pseudoxanthomonas daejeonensis]|uniref:CPXCG motif-containing cysteine-rich protein n=1 Tax=Pseudoxanthomonas daejeonensis TaxID=266062 RepID=UPI001F545CE0|nr:CPXCG motif-containing cysteine-rich protein [Pseudoxanthomonas daejeonensis]UNK56343.1 CPXCG motif-containing cysteine-rich protein [Pseudoxanthomonas daejeonensis]
MTRWRELRCPYCGERIDVAVDDSAGDQDYIEDCQVCCRPIAISVSVDGPGDEPRVVARREDEA